MQNVAQRFLADVEMDDAQKAACVKMCQFFHSDTTELAAKMMSALRRPYYVTPTAFLELIQTFKTLLAKKRKEVGDLKFKYENGLEKLTTTEGAVAPSPATQRPCFGIIEGGRHFVVPRQCSCLAPLGVVVVC